MVRLNASLLGVGAVTAVVGDFSGSDVFVVGAVAPFFAHVFELVVEAW